MKTIKLQLEKINGDIQTITVEADKVITAHGVEYQGINYVYNGMTDGFKVAKFVERGRILVIKDEDVIQTDE